MGTKALPTFALTARHSAFSSNYALYGDISERVMSLIEAMVPAVAAVDQVFRPGFNYSKVEVLRLNLSAR